MHYSHDPEKDGRWYAQERAKYKRQEDWDREQELDFLLTGGIRAYHAFRAELHTLDGDRRPYRFEIVPSLPLCLMVDFNVEPMLWVVGQIRHDALDCIEEVRLAPASIANTVREFRNRWPAHPAELWVYGDAMGKFRHVQTAETDYQLMEAAFRGYPSPIVWKVPRDNPREKDRLNAVNLKLQGIDGRPGIRIDSVGCPDLVRDFSEVVLDPQGAHVLKIRDRADPYHERTHASDAVGYLVAREWPVIDEAMKSHSTKPRAPLKHGRLLGALP